MTNSSSSPSCEFEELESYLNEINESELLEYIQHDGDHYNLIQEKYSINQDNVIKQKLACVFALLGEHSTATQIYGLDWKDISPLGNNVVRGLIKRFVKTRLI